MATPRGQLVIGVGTVCLDHLAVWRDAGEPVAAGRIVEYAVQGGGMIGTALAAVARLGGRAECWSAVGADRLGDRIVEGLDREGVDTRGVVRVGDAVGPLAVVSIDGRTGDRWFPYWTGMPEPGGGLGSLGRIRAAGCVLVDGKFIETALAAAGEARRLGVPVVGDYEHGGENVRSLLPHTDYAIFSRDGIAPLGGAGELARACGAARDLGAGRVIVTLGAEGLAWLDGDVLGRMPAFDVDVVDTTGAGDVFHGAFCRAVTVGFAFGDALRFASAAAALSCRALGGRAGIPDRAELEAFLELAEG